MHNDQQKNLLLFHVICIHVAFVLLCSFCHRFTFYVMPDGYVVHLPHTKAKVNRHRPNVMHWYCNHLHLLYNIFAEVKANFVVGYKRKRSTRLMYYKLAICHQSSKYSTTFLKHPLITPWRYGRPRETCFNYSDCI